MSAELKRSILCAIQIVIINKRHLRVIAITFIDVQCVWCWVEFNTLRILRICYSYYHRYDQAIRLEAMRARPNSSSWTQQPKSMNVFRCIVKTILSLLYGFDQYDSQDMNFLFSVIIRYFHGLFFMVWANFLFVILWLDCSNGCDKKNYWQMRKNVTLYTDDTARCITL